MLGAIKYFHLLSMTVWIGSMVFFSFVVAPAVFKNFERQMAGDIVGLVFPKYFMLGMICAVIALVTLFMLGSKVGFVPHIKVGLILLCLMGGLVASQGFVLGPKARQVKADIRALADDDANKQQLRKKFGKLHGASVVINVVILFLGLGLLFFIIRYISLS
ncbi:hypothetical protein MNBD_NITROSPINAE02-1888 [hydrothermal vent metagenome]|uniref:TMEM205-like domain-containing protein n=1 Tax=hydrothermal vent metagenome TaxID=652676 RepID=A0A3B1CDB2_9ZZZZ